MKSLILTLSILAAALCCSVGLTAAMAPGSPPMKCEPTHEDHLGPFYEPNAPLRSKVGEGYLLSGVVKSAADCSPVAGARIELWLAGPQGRYDDAHRATVITDSEGGYRFESDPPPPYSGRPPHIHLRVTAPGFRTLVTQHYPEAEASSGRFDLVLIPSP